MNINDIKEYIKNNSQDEELNIYLGSLADSRVNNALAKLNNKIPDMVNEETNKRMELVKERQDSINRESEFNQGLQDRLKTLNVSEKLGQSLLTGLTQDSTPEQIDQKFNEIESIQLDMVKSFESELSGARKQYNNVPGIKTIEEQVMSKLNL